MHELTPCITIVNYSKTITLPDQGQIDLLSGSSTNSGTKVNKQLMWTMC